MQNSRKIGVLMGGMSAEREVSLKSGKAIFDALLAMGYNAVAIDVGRDLPQKLIEEKVEVAMLAALHGKWGEDGCVQGLLEIMGIPYTGCSTIASAIGMDKIIAKQTFRYHGLPTADWIVVEKNSGPLKSADIPFGLPCVIKPATEGSSIGVSIVRNEEELHPGFESAFEYDGRILIEPYIKGRELNVGVLNGDALGIVEVRPKEGFYDYKNKYTPGNTEYLCPAPLDAHVEKEVKRIGAAASEVIGCTGIVRVEMILDEKERLFLLEVNTLPGMTTTSLVPKIAKLVGIDFQQLVKRILQTATLHIGN